MSPAPTRSAVCCSNPVKIRFASWMPADATDTALAPIAVSVRTRLATENVVWKRRFSNAPAVPACWAARYASFSWPRIWGSPRIRESSPDATENT